jgi:opacity protein-like surface antigen
MKHFAIAATAALALLGTSAQAQTTARSAQGLYGEVGYTHLKLKVDGVSGDATLGALRGILGYDLHPNLALEGLLAFGVKDDEASDVVSGIPVTAKLELQNAFGIYVKPKFNPTNELELFGRLGWTRTKLKATLSIPGASASESDSDSDFSYGVGAKYNFNPRMSVGLDWMRYFDKDGVTIDGVTVGFGYRF